MDVGSAIMVAVDAHAGPGGGHELHQPLRAGGAGVVVAPVPGFFHADAGEQRPGDLVPVGGGRYSFLIFGGIGSGGLCSEARRGVPGRGIGNPTPPSCSVPARPSDAGDVVFLDGAMALPSSGAPRLAMNRTGLTGVPLTSTWKCRCNPVLVPVEPSMPIRCPIPTPAPGTMLGSILARCP